MQRTVVGSRFFPGIERTGELFKIECLYWTKNQVFYLQNIFNLFYYIFRSKSKDRGESEYNKVPSRSETIYKSFTTIKRDAEGNNNEDSVSISSSRSSLASWDLALRQSFNKHVSIPL